MDKAQTLQLIENIIKSNKTQMHNISTILEKKDGDELCSIAKNECDFGRLLYENEQHLKNVMGSLFYDKIEKLHEAWHVEYYNIYKILQKHIKGKQEKKGFLSKIMGDKKISDMEIDKAKLYFSELKKAQAELQRSIEAAQRRLMALNESKFV